MVNEVKQEIINEFIGVVVSNMKHDMDDIQKDAITGESGDPSDREWEKEQGYPKGSMTKMRNNLFNNVIKKLQDKKFIESLFTI